MEFEFDSIELMLVSQTIFWGGSNQWKLTAILCVDGRKQSRLTQFKAIKRITVRSLFNEHQSELYPVHSVLLLLLLLPICFVLIESSRWLLVLLKFHVKQLAIPRLIFYFDISMHSFLFGLTMTYNNNAYCKHATSGGHRNNWQGITNYHNQCVN